jgi:hypothetical protein
MLEPWIIEQIRRREEEERRKNEQRPRLELPVPDGRWPARNESEEEEEDYVPDRDEPTRGVVIIGL